MIKWPRNTQFQPLIVFLILRQHKYVAGGPIAEEILDLSDGFTFISLNSGPQQTAQKTRRIPRLSAQPQFDEVVVVPLEIQGIK